MRLNGPQYRQLTEALLDAFPTPARLTQMVRFRLDRNLSTIALGDDLTEIVFRLIQTAEAEGWTAQLIAGARDSNPGNPHLLAFAQQFGLAPATPSQPELERIIKATDSFLDVDRWRTRLGEIEGQVCRIEIQPNEDTIYGTGFLVGPDVVITNYHVVEAVIQGEQGHTTDQKSQALSSDVILRFDYKRLADGTTLNPGTVYRLAKDWLIDKSPMSPVDGQPEPKSGVPQLDELDYALLRLDSVPGDTPVGDKPEPEAPLRKWIKVPTQSHHFQPDTALFIVQHPQGEPLQLALDTNAIIGLNENHTRVAYRTNTLPGSSGSPCFNSNWELVALHHSGDPNFAPTHRPTYNEGIPFTAILALLEKRGLSLEQCVADAYAESVSPEPAHVSLQRGSAASSGAPGTLQERTRYLDTQILRLLYEYFLEHPGDPRMDLGELTVTLRFELADVIQCLLGLKEKEWLDYSLTENAQGGVIWLTRLGIRIAKSAR